MKKVLLVLALMVVSAAAPTASHKVFIPVMIQTHWVPCLNGYIDPITDTVHCHPVGPPLPPLVPTP